MTQLSDWLDARAQEIAQETKLDAARIRKVLGGAIRDSAGRGVPEDADVNPESTGTFLWPEVRDGIPYLDAERSLQLLEEIGAHELGDRLLMVDSWSQFGPPLYRFTDITALLGTLLSLQARNRAHLLRTGYAGEVLADSLWLHRRMANLYPVKAPALAEIVAENRDRITIDYCWIKEPWDYVLDSSGHMSIVGPGRAPRDVGLPTACDYSESPRLSGVSRRTASRVEALRPRVLDFKLEALQLITQAARGGTDGDLTGEFIRLFRSSFQPKEARLLLGLDAILDRRLVEATISRGDTLEGEGGGIASIARIVPLVETYLKSHGVEDVRDILERDRLIDRSPLADPRPQFQSYFEVIDQPYRSTVDEALAEFRKVLANEHPVNLASLRRIYAAMPTEVVIRRAVWQEHSGQFKSAINDYVQHIESHWAATGSLPTAGVLPPADAGSRPEAGEILECVFRKEGETWELGFGGKTIHLKDSIGLAYLRELLARPRQDVLAVTLSEVVHHARASFAADHREEIVSSIDSMSGFQIGTAFKEQPMADPQAILETKREIEKLVHQIARALSRDDTQAAAEMDKQKAVLERHLLSEIGYGGRPRNMPAEGKRIADTVTYNINVARKKIRPAHKDLGKHLDDFITAGIICSYNPDSHTPWKF